MALYGDIWTLIESFGFFVIIIIFFLDPVRRWNFLGYRPTAVVGLFDPALECVLMVQVREAGGGPFVWSFNQGGMYDLNILSTTSEILTRELALEETRFKLLYTEPLGTVKIKEALIIKRARISTISLFPHLRGKGYMAYYVQVNLKDIEAVTQKGEGVHALRVVSIEEAKALVTSATGAEHCPRKQEMILHMLDTMASHLLQK